MKGTPVSPRPRLRLRPSDVLLLVLSALTLLAACLVLGGLAARPFAG